MKRTISTVASMAAESTSGIAIPAQPAASDQDDSSSESSQEDSSWQPEPEESTLFPSGDQEEEQPTTSTSARQASEQSSPLAGSSDLDDNVRAHNEQHHVRDGSNSKRPYTFRTRTPLRKPKRVSPQVKWVNDLTMVSEARLRRTECCKKLKCTRRVSYSFFMNKSREILSLPRSLRHNILRTFLAGDGRYYFDGNPVCQNFLKTSFHFGSDSVSAVVKSSNSDSISTPSSAQGTVQTARSATVPRRNNSSVDRSPLHRKKKEAIVSFLLRLAEDCGEKQPDRREIHLPFHQRKELYPVFHEESKRLYPNTEIASSQYFRQVWKEVCPQYKVMKNQRFTTCDECDRIRSGLKAAILRCRSTKVLKEQRVRHLKYIFRERMAYQTKKDRARLNGSDFCSIIVDGADQSAFGLPHFTTKPKSQRGHAMKVKLIGLLEHRIENDLTLLTMTEEHATGANHVVEVIHRFLNSKRMEGSLPRKFFVQLDNCSRENKNKYVLSYLEMLVALSVFDSVEVGFLPVGHTHEDVDQAFSQTSARLRVNNAVTLKDLHIELQQANKGRSKVQHMQRVANWSGLCDSENCLRKIDRVTQWRYFLFTRDSSCNYDVDEKPLLTKCSVKRNCDDSWQDMFTANAGCMRKGILRNCPDLRKTPDLKIDCPDGVDKISKRITSEEGRINNTDKMISLYQLRDFVFADRLDKFHWDLGTSIETEFCGMYKQESEQDGDSDGVPLMRAANNAENMERVGDSNEINNNLQRRDIEPDFVPEHNISDDRAITGSLHNDSTEAVQLQSNQPVSDRLNNRNEVQRASTDNTSPINKVTYKVGSFVAVRHDSESPNSNMNIWIARVLSVINAEGTTYAKKIRVQWYDRSAKSNDGRDIIQCAFHPCVKEVQRKTRRLANSNLTTRQRLDTPWIDEIDTDTIVLSFESLTKRGNLPLSVQSRLSG